MTTFAELLKMAQRTQLADSDYTLEDLAYDYPDELIEAIGAAAQKTEDRRSRRIQEALDAIDRAKSILAQYQRNQTPYNLVQVILNAGVVISCVTDNALTRLDKDMLGALIEPLASQATDLLGVK